MAQPYIGEIRMFAGNFAPAGWAFCNGQLVPISENDALFILIGTTYGGDGQETFALPNLQSRLPVHMGNSFVIGQAAGVESVTLTTQQMPIHNHTVLASTDNATATDPTGNTIGTQGDVNVTPFGADQPIGPMNPASISPVGGSQPHTNFQPYICINYIISLFGLFPSQT
jgi:microcystin-dependent protein